MPSGDLRELASYVVSCSLNSLGSFYLQRLDRASQLEHNLREVARELVETLALAEMADLFLHHGEEIIAANTQSSARAPRFADRDSAEQSPRSDLRDWWHLWKDARIDPDREFHVLMGINKETHNPIDPKSDDPAKKFAWTKPLRYESPELTCNGKHSPAHVKRIILDLCARKIVAKSGGRSHHGQQFRIRNEAQREWLAPNSPRIVKPKISKPRARASFERSENGAWKLKLNGKEFETPERPTFKARPADGKGLIDLPEGSEISLDDVAATAHSAALLHEGDEKAHSAQPLHEEAKPHSATVLHEGTGTASDHSAALRYEGKARRVPIIGLDNKAVCSADGLGLVVHVPNGKELYRNRREEKDALLRSPEGVFTWFLGRNFNPRWEPLPAQPKRASEPDRVVVVSGPTGIWDRTLAQIHGAAKSSPMHVDPHTFSTWLQPTREEGRKADGTMVIRTPSRPFSRRLSETLQAQIRIAFATVTGEKTPLLQYVTEEQIDIVPPGSQPAGLNDKTLAARGGTHK